MPAVIVVGTQWGDEGKGKIVDLLSARAEHVVRAQGGNNAGHTIVIGQEEFKLHLVPSGILTPKTQCYIGGGTVIDPQVLLGEIDALAARGVALLGRLWISPAAHVIFPYHKKMDALCEQGRGALKIGTTGRGIGPCYADKATRLGIRMGTLVRPNLLRPLLEEALERKNAELEKLYAEPPLPFEEIFEAYRRFGEALSPFVKSFQGEIEKAISSKALILFEGAQGTFLDSSFGTYPYVTSSSTLAGGVCSGAGVGPTCIDHTLGVVKAYTTRVGSGPFPTELEKSEVFRGHFEARECGTTTGRLRRVGWLDPVLLREAIRLSGINSIALTKLDVLDELDSIKMCVGYECEGQVCGHVPDVAEDFAKMRPVYKAYPGWRAPLGGVRRYEDLPAEAKVYIEAIEAECGVPVSILSLGPEREATIVRQELF